MPDSRKPIFDARGVVEHLPGEPIRDRPAPPLFVLRILLRAVKLTVIAALTLWLWPIYLLAGLVGGWPPVVPRRSQVRRYLRLIWTVRPPAPGLSLPSRCWLSLLVIRKVLLTPVAGLAWLLDQLLYGEQLRRIAIVEPLVEISAARSGSTQLARYIEDDPQVVAPMVLQAMFPYLWLWRLLAATVGRVMSREQLRAKIEAKFPPEFRERHEGDPFRTDTFEATLYLTHLNHLAPLLGPEVMIEDFGFAEIAAHNRSLWEQDFIDLLDGTARKTLLQAGLGPDGRPPRFFVKGHFLGAADIVARRYPDARFLTMIREPGPRLRSAANFLQVNPLDPVLAGVPWAWLGQAISHTEVVYCEREQEWFDQQRAGPRRCVLRFDDFVRDLEGAMTKVYRECLDTPTLPDHAPREHPPRERTNYTINRTLAEIGVDEAALNQRLQRYIAWCRGA